MFPFQKLFNVKLCHSVVSIIRYRKTLNRLSSVADNIGYLDRSDHVEPCVGISHKKQKPSMSEQRDSNAEELTSNTVE